MIVCNIGFLSVVHPHELTIIYTCPFPLELPPPPTIPTHPGDYKVPL